MWFKDKMFYYFRAIDPAHIAMVKNREYSYVAIRIDEAAISLIIWTICLLAN